MGSKKRSAWARERETFRAGLDASALDAAFAHEHEHDEQRSAQHEAALRYKACESKNRYASRQEAQAAARACEAHGSPKLFAYRCDYCGGWHLTHHRPRG